jgi:hypothetical protein
MPILAALEVSAGLVLMVVRCHSCIHHTLNSNDAELQPRGGVMPGTTIDDDCVTARTVRARPASGEQHGFSPDQPANDSKAPTAASTGWVVLRNVNDILSVYQIHGGARLLRVDDDNWPDSVA